MCSEIRQIRREGDMRTDTTVTGPTTETLDAAEGLVRRYTHAHPPFADGGVLPAIPDEFVAALATIDGHDRAGFQRLLAEFNVVDATALTAILRAVRHYGATAALRWAETGTARTAAD
jgi:hypothetical protein